MLLAVAILLPRLVDAAPQSAIQLPTPTVEYRTNIASATRKPWVVSNGPRLEQDQGKIFYYDATGRGAALAAAEAFAYGREACIHTDAEGTGAFKAMLEYLKALPTGPSSPMPDKVRLFGSEVTIAHLTSDGTHVRLHLINYGERPVRALRVRVPGKHSKAPAGVTDDDIAADAIEFTVPEIGVYLAIDLPQ